MDNFKYECACKIGCHKPQNKYLTYLLDEFEKCSQQNSDLSKLQKEHSVLRKDLTEAQRQIRDLCFEKQLLSDKVTSMQRELQEQKLLHAQLRDECSGELRNLYRKLGNQEKDFDLVKYQLKMGSKKYSLDLENLRWELTSSLIYGSTSTSFAPASDMLELTSDKP